MRGDDNQQEGMFSYISPEKRVPADHPLRAIRKMVDEILKEMSPQFAKLYSDVGRPSIAPERLLRSLLLQIFYSVRSERMFIEQLQYNLLLRWFVGMEIGRDVKESEVARDREGRVAVHLHRSRLQPLPIAKPDGQSMTRSVASGWFSS
jgi:transposase